MIVKINAFSVSIDFLQSAQQGELSVTSFKRMSVAVVTWNSKTTFLTDFKIIKLIMDALSVFMIFFKVLYQRINESILS